MTSSDSSQWVTRWYCMGI